MFDFFILSSIDDLNFKYKNILKKIDMNCSNILFLLDKYIKN